MTGLVCSNAIVGFLFLESFGGYFSHWVLILGVLVFVPIYVMIDKYALAHYPTFILILHDMVMGRILLQFTILIEFMVALSAIKILTIIAGFYYIPYFKGFMLMFMSGLLVSVFVLGLSWIIFKIKT
ncbi:hypothetical protein [Moraxella bovis]|uniref:Uncharacterized protein n=1 Tax=Moraxella bovis TaxID=476 RepID=A0A378PY94_MORBO|nr:hypothetical protein [Moraxella bovis]UYZ67926.1 hypothetical protein LP122_09110 [Moraxella bovis]UYZ70300.1 hypothetical protein LP089_09210 [Moraxella bovis]UYZ73790.1 hypothetical protein LP105_03520 [Moraxella bovis]UYZ90123.1 hypothetical protein LP114_03330 [Moraxella bovis]UYZ94706.1 hypothetical protein LP121_12690 [Moraxella bovis]